MAELTQLQRKSVAGLCHLWRSGKTPPFLTTILAMIAREEPGGATLCGYLNDMRVQLELIGRSAFAFSAESDFESYLHDHVGAIIASERMRAEAEARARAERDAKLRAEAEAYARALAEAEATAATAKAVALATARAEYDELGLQLASATSDEQLIALAKRRWELATFIDPTVRPIAHCYQCDCGLSPLLNRHCATCRKLVCECEACMCKYEGIPRSRQYDPNGHRMSRPTLSVQARREIADEKHEEDDTSYYVDTPF